MTSKTATMAGKTDKTAQDESERFQYGPRGIQEVFQEGPRELNSQTFLSCLKDVDIPSVLVFRPPNTAQGVPNIVPEVSKMSP
eukprot:183966-Pyramimonas_sp.AAC.1